MVDPVVVESWHLPRALSDEALRLLTALPMEEIEARLRMDEPAAPETPTDKELLEMMTQSFRDDLAAVSRMAAHGAGPDITPGLFRVSLNTGALDFARAVLARWGTADGKVADPALRPIPVCERLPEPEDCVPHPRTKRGNWCWGFERCEVSLARPARWRLMHMEAVEMEASHWLPAHALPLPEVER